MFDQAQQQVLKIVQTLLSVHDSSAIDSQRISEAIDQVLMLQPAWKDAIDRAAITEELIRRFSIWVGQDSTLANDVGHVPWLTAGRKHGWRYWQRYREYLEGSISENALKALDASTDSILGHLEDPTRKDAWDRRGLVVGHVQSGKTSSYTGLICKAADAGYKIIIVLAGLHNNLRSQTQIRLDEGFLGYETKPNPHDLRRVGVGLIDMDPNIRPNYATNRANNGDFNRAVARNLGISPEQRPWLFVVKKNATVLKLLLSWVRNRVANIQDPETGRALVTNLPLLLIDDEADHASVDTGENVVDENGNPDQEHEPKAINRLIRQILFSFSRCAYVGYTATPFANIFIHERGNTIVEGPDLFPAAFIVNLATPSSYVGPAKLFGVQSDTAQSNGLPLTRTTDDFVDDTSSSGWMPPAHKADHRPQFQGKNEIPASLRKAIYSFMLSCVARKLRGQGDQHCSMLIHVTRFTAVQDHVWRQVDAFVNDVAQKLRRNIEADSILAELKMLWECDFIATSSKVRETYPEEVPSIASWDQVAELAPEVCREICVRKINGTAKDVLDYAENEKNGIKVIAIGGDKLSRGLTLEGLTISYFLRASRMYDTLMQMGRWFGYRPGYLDLCRLFTTNELIDWFRHIAEASEELRRDFDLMAQSGATPLEYGLRVQSHPVLLVTSRIKMRAAKNLMLSFSGEVVETVSLFRDSKILDQNLRALSSFVNRLGSPEVNPHRLRDGRKETWCGYAWDGVDASLVTEFLLNYRSHPEAYKVNTQLLSEFIADMNRARELTRWSVALIGSPAGREVEIATGIRPQLLTRTGDASISDRYSIGRLLSPRDEAIDLDDQRWRAALELTRKSWKPDPARKRKDPPEIPNGPAIRYVRGFGDMDSGILPLNTGLLLLYMLDPLEANVEFGSDATPPVVAVGVSFPGSNAGVKVEYRVNNVLWEQEYGHSE